MFQRIKSMGIAALGIVAAILIFTIFYIKQNNQVYDYTDYAMSTVIQFHLYGSGAKESAAFMMNELNYLENDVMSWRIENSSIAKLNQTAGETSTVEEELYQWLLEIEQIEKDSNGALDITILPVAELWNIEGDNPQVPEEKKLQEALSKVNYEHIHLKDKNQVQLEEGTLLDIGAVGKGIACDKIAQWMQKEGIKSGTVSVGGSICVKGEKPDKSAWKLGIQNPRGNTGEVFGVYETKENCFLSTSGDYEKYFMKGNVRYHHIIDPSDGYPADSGLISVTIISDSGLISDALSTACFILGRSKGIKLAEKYGAEAIFVDTEKNVYMTKKTKEKFQLLVDDYIIQ